ncbi:DUF6096 family protein [Clostridium porci]|uniref:DUF6096 family protein n=1 Tax=Clostridium porci TaxID=2605778 RepID=UPI003A8D59FD
MGQLFGMDEEMEDDKKVNSMEDIKGRKKPFAYWKAGDEELKLKLTTAQICKLEEKYRTNLLTLLTGGDIPPLGIMLTVIQCAATPWNHGLKLKNLQALFDKYVDEGGTQITLFADVIMDILIVSGFFTESQKEDVQDKMEDAKALL